MAQNNKYFFFSFLNKTFPTLLHIPFLILDQLSCRSFLSILKLSISDGSLPGSSVPALRLTMGKQADLWDSLVSNQSQSSGQNFSRSVNIFCFCNHSLFVFSSDILHPRSYLVSLRQKSTQVLLRNGCISEAIPIQIRTCIFFF